MSAMVTVLKAHETPEELLTFPVFIRELIKDANYRIGLTANDCSNKLIHKESSVTIVFW